MRRKRERGKLAKRKTYPEWFITLIAMLTIWREKVAKRLDDSLVSDRVGRSVLAICVVIGITLVAYALARTVL
jgi:hypothetical protein